MVSSEKTKKKIILIGVGNEYRGDDGVGAFIVRQLKKTVPAYIKVIEESGEGAKLIEAWKDTNTAFLFDAVSLNTHPGTIYHFDAQKKPIPKGFFNYSTHLFSIAEAIELARALQQLPEQLIVYGIEGKTFQSGMGLSQEVEKAAAEVIKKAQEEIRLLLNV